MLYTFQDLQGLQDHVGLLEQQGSLGVMVPLGVLVPLVPVDPRGSGGVRVTGVSQADRVSPGPWDHLEPLDLRARQEQLGHLVCTLSYKLYPFNIQHPHNYMYYPLLHLKLLIRRQKIMLIEKWKGIMIFVVFCCRFIWVTRSARSEWCNWCTRDNRGYWCLRAHWCHR